MRGRYPSIGFALLLGVWTYSAPRAQPSLHGGGALVLQGSTTFAHAVMDQYQSAIQAASGHRMVVVATKSSLGLLALFQDECDLAMISGPLNDEIKQLRSRHPDLPFDRLRAFNIADTRMAFAVNRDNPVERITDDAMRRILLGVLTNWREVGGRDQEIRIVHVRAGGGVQASVEGNLLGGQPLNVSNPIAVQVSSQVVKITEQMPEALGLAQLSVVRRSNARELKTEHPILQPLTLVTLNDPTPEMRAVIDAAREIGGKAPAL